MLIDIQSKESIHKLSSVKWLIEDESIPVAEFNDVLKNLIFPYPPPSYCLRSAKFSIDKDYVVFLEVQYRGGIYGDRDCTSFIILTHDNARDFLKIVKNRIEERANKMKSVIDNFDQPKTKSDPPPPIILPAAS